MSTPFFPDPARSALLSMDCQSSIVSIYAKDPESVLARTASVLKRARDLSMTVIHVKVGFRPNLPEASPRNVFLHAIKSSPRHQQIFEGAAGAIHPAIAPEGNDITITKHRVSAFVGTDLELILRAKDIDTLILLGIATSGVVLSTFLHAADADFRTVVIKDCCLDLDQEVHSCLVDKVFPRQGTVISTDEFLTAVE